MRRLSEYFLCLGAILGGATGCGGALDAALDAFHDGRLPEAAGELRSLEPRVGTASERERARYALYRGLAELGLGNARVAERWLFAAWRADVRDPRLFDAKEHGELFAAWRSLGHLPGEAGAT